MKTLIILSIVLVAAFAAPEPRAICTPTSQHDYYECPDDSSTNIRRVPVFVTGSFLQVKSGVYQSPPSTKKITCIKVENQDVKSKGGCPKVTGAVGDKQITIEFISQRSLGYNFVVSIYYDP